MTDTLALTQALCTRLCHDLAGPVGAVAAGVELVGGDPAQVDAETLQLIAGSSAAAAQKLKFLRIALGLPGSAAALAELPGVARGYLAAVAGLGGAAELVWPEPAALAPLAAALPEATPQIVANLMILGIECIPRLKRLVLGGGPGPALALDAIGEVSARLDPRAGLIALLARPEAAALTPKTVQAVYAADLVARHGGRLAAEAIDGGCRIIAVFDRG